LSLRILRLIQSSFGERLNLGILAFAISVLFLF
jgi:hypothetical protein